VERARVNYNHPDPLEMDLVVEFHNLLVYEHSTVDDMMVYRFAKERLNDFTNSSNAVRGYFVGALDAADTNLP
jgi:uncharacterized protein YutE (UPF0331/DUF86 family)